MTSVATRCTRHRGSAAVLAVVLVGALALVAVVVTVVGGAVADQRRVEAAADLGALAGASAAQRGEPGCARAAVVVAGNHARLLSCAADGGVVEVRAARVTGALLGLRITVTSRARAGPAGTGSRDAVASVGAPTSPRRQEPTSSPDDPVGQGVAIG